MLRVGAGAAKRKEPAAHLPDFGDRLDQVDAAVRGQEPVDLLLAEGAEARLALPPALLDEAAFDREALGAELEVVVAVRLCREVLTDKAKGGYLQNVVIRKVALVRVGVVAAAQRLAPFADRRLHAIIN